MGVVYFVNTKLCNYIYGSSSQSAVDTTLADSECYGLAGSDVRMSCFVNKALVNVGGELAKVVPGRVSTEVDACLTYDTHSFVRKVLISSSLLVPSHLISFEILNYTENEDFTFSFVHGQDAYSILVLPDDDTSNLQCESQLLFLGHSKVPNSTDGQVNLDIENANAYPPCLVDMDIEKGNSETPKTNDEDVEKLKIEGPLTHLQKALQRQISLQIGEKVVQLLMNSLVSPKFHSRGLAKNLARVAPIKMPLHVGHLF
ncbi:hypothetical protein HYC85_031966 [Camellia sinensis]|uniref:Uncharacterized protein n=1 Tax=Camellia sinensis TaxID=4442 RepID=A0A7J7FRW8_CAMSI|nr:hypothetical protein HYC85_031966 [Camellia sinensis]